MPAAAAVPTAATVTSSAAVGVRFIGTDAKDQVVLTRAGTSAAPLVVLDAAAPLTVGIGCQPVAGDPTRATCAAPIASGTTLKKVILNGRGGDDVFAHGVSLPIPMLVNGGEGNDTVNAGPGQDTLFGDNGHDTLRGGDGTDTLKGSFGDDRLEGGAGRDDALFGGPGVDVLLGGDGDSDDLTGGPGSDTIDGGPGRLDVVLYDDRSTGVNVDLGSTTAGNGDPGVGEKDRFLTGIENAVGGDGDDVISGNAGDNNLLGGDGVDIIQGGLGQDAVIGQGGNDILTGNKLSLFGNNVVNSDGVTDFIGGLAGDDTCIRSTQDPDSVNECETIVVDN
jgi:hypothetical protein